LTADKSYIEASTDLVEGIKKQRDSRLSKNDTYQRLKALSGAHRDPVDVLLLETPYHPLCTPGDFIEGEGLV
jgi:hypothetical protein